MAESLHVLTEAQKTQFEQEGYLIVKRLFEQTDVERLRATFEEIGQRVVPHHFEPDLSAKNQDPLRRYPRVMHPHRFDATAKQYMLHPAVLEVLRDLYEEEPLAAQSMYYYKPPGARGQALHQDNFYLKVAPGNCIAAWTAIDAADEDNGTLLVVPKTQDYDIVCPELSDASESFTTHFVKPPKDRAAVPVRLESGDVLFFNGNLIHGSYRNRTKDRFRRSFICHYANSSADRISEHYHPLYHADGSEAVRASNSDGGPCGIEHEPLYPH
ncbi:phytanoyl-CoA dioxygenase family protein [Paenibacillus sp. IB182496]|uniref:Phytanoyl-CoA dioxygenase family protein n=1 Tax=Paenibacillus sabuli TaxID=2772509 RepID=A0A927BP97_9BACL|nr:phytanoyl-CoA dioxygenase family protein [Paenibacillus sabuli]MBD2844211.1 phytanoyl-CoA dioxygenase family protein [Paenibacillus sabuli]